MKKSIEELHSAPFQPRAATGIAGLDNVLGGGLPTRHVYLVEGTPGAGKTTLGLQFLLAGRAMNERGLYVTLSETAEELAIVALSHGWSLDGIDVFEMVPHEGLSPDQEQSILYPSEVELGETTRAVMAAVERLQPARLVFDSLSEMRLLAQDPSRYRRQILALKHFFASRNCTVLLLDNMTSEGGDLQLHSIAHGVIAIVQRIGDYGPVHRHLGIVKMRGVRCRGGEHDLLLDTGGIQVFPRLIAAEHQSDFVLSLASTGTQALDQLLGGGLSRGSNTLLIGPSGIGKTTTSMSAVLAALQRGERANYYLFNEGIDTLRHRCIALGIDIRPFVDSGHLQLLALDPAEVSPGQFSNMVRQAVEQAGVGMIVIDSLNAYMQSMSGAKSLALQMRELLRYLSQQGIVTLLVLGQHGLMGEVRTDIDFSYPWDAILLFRFFEAEGTLLKAVSVVKSRTNRHEVVVREFHLGDRGIEVGPPLTDFQGLLPSVSVYRGAVPLLGAAG